jgi:hypothetical protein
MLAAEGGTSGKAAYDEAMAAMPDSFFAPDVPAAAALARIRHAVYGLNLAARHGHIAAAKQLEALAGRRDVVVACCVGCGAVRKLETCSKCCIARFCDMECACGRRIRRAARRGVPKQRAAGRRVDAPAFPQLWAGRLAHRFSRAARVGGVAQALEVGPLLGGTCLLGCPAAVPFRPVARGACQHLSLMMAF